MKHFRSVNSWYRHHFNRRMQRLPLHAGATCPNRDGTIGYGGCLYCDERGSAADFINFHDSLQIQFEEGVERIERRYRGSGIILYFQPYTLTHGPVDTVRDFITQALRHEELGGISIGTRPDCLSDEWVEYLTELNRNIYVELELGLESAHDTTLKMMNRGHDRSAFDRAVGKLSGTGLKLITHVILGLPGENLEHIRKTALHLASLPLHGIKIHAMHVMASSPLARSYGLSPGTSLQGGEHLTARGLPEMAVLTLESYSDLLAEFLAILPPSLVIYRYTGERFSDDLIGPLWVKDKNFVLKVLREKLEATGISIG